MKKLNTLVRQYLVKYGFHQYELAEILGVHEATVSKWLNKRELPEQKQLELIAVIQKEGEKREQYPNRR